MENTIVLYILLLIAAAFIAAAISSYIIRKKKAPLEEEISHLRTDLIRTQAQLKTSETLRENEKQTFRESLERMKAAQAEAIEAAKNALALENEKTLRAREESLRKEAEKTMATITGSLNKDIKDMKDAFDAQKKSQTEESASIRTQFAQTVQHLKEQTESIGMTAGNLANALKGKNKMQGIFGETILENILKSENLREGHDYDSEVWLRDRKGNRIVNEQTGKTMRPDFALHFPDDTDILIDSKVSLTALSDYFEAETDQERAEASRRNLESVMNHVRELTSKEYQRYVVGRKTLDYIIMFIPNYGAYQLAKQEDSEIFAKAFKQNVLITTEETLIPFLRLIRTAWVQKEQMDNIAEIVSAAQNMVSRVALFCEKNAEVERSLETALRKFKENSARLADSDQSIVSAAWKAVNHGIKQPAGRELPALVNSQKENNNTFL